MFKIQFLGAAGTVTGSKYLVYNEKFKILIDGGQFQGEREWKEKNKEKPPFNPKDINAVLLTHAHIDHTGMLPRYTKLGLKCPIYCTAPTLELTKILLLDSAHLQEEEAEYRGRHKNYSRHSPPEPLFNSQDASKCNALLKSVPVNKEVKIMEGITATWKRMGHIIGACSITLNINNERVTFSGDVGRYNSPILVDPTPVEFGNTLLIESTYANKVHSEENPEDKLAEYINRTIEKKGVLLIPSFAVGRMQLLLFYLKKLKEKNKIPNIPIIVDSPMAIDATKIYQQHPEDYDEESLKIISNNETPFSPEKLIFTRKATESIKLNSVEEPMIILAGSGMLSGGRILHHLKHRIEDERNSLLFVGYQSPGSRGGWLKAGNKTFRLFGQETKVGAEVFEISGLSAHADKNELIKWCKQSTGKPDNVYIVHGEDASRASFKETLKEELNFNCSLPSYLSEITI